jgi:hypothetical protein
LEIGKNGIVFETRRPDDPLFFANRFRQALISQKKKESVNESKN